jgi:hypothetical protein
MFRRGRATWRAEGITNSIVYVDDYDSIARSVNADTGRRLLP